MAATTGARWILGSGEMIATGSKVYVGYLLILFICIDRTSGFQTMR